MFIYISTYCSSYTFQPIKVLHLSPEKALPHSSINLLFWDDHVKLQEWWNYFISQLRWNSCAMYRSGQIQQHLMGWEITASSTEGELKTLKRWMIIAIKLLTTEYLTRRGKWTNEQQTLFGFPLFIFFTFNLLMLQEEEENEYLSAVANAGIHLSGAG